MYCNGTLGHVFSEVVIFNVNAFCSGSSSVLFIYDEGPNIVLKDTAVNLWFIFKDFESMSFHLL